MTESRLPIGTATFLFTDIEGSTVLLQELGERFDEVLTLHHRIMREAVEAQQGYVVGTEGDAFFVVFASAIGALAAAVAAQQALAAAAWPHGSPLRVRMGLHTGEATLGGDNYVGIDVHRAARIAAAGHGGQLLVSESTQVLVRDALPGDAILRDLGEHRLKDLSRRERLYQVDIRGGQTEFPPLKTLDAVPNNLPLQLTSFVGREREVAEGGRLLMDGRLVTLTGPGGTGKTRLSLQLAAEAADAFPDGTYYVPLGLIVDPDMVPMAIVQALGLQDSGGRPPQERLQDYLREKQVLLVLDNFEQVVAAAPVVVDLLRSDPKIKILVSSRAALRVYGEQEFPVPPLALPDMANLPDAEALTHYEAVKLFIERAMAAKPDFGVTNENAPAVAAICIRLDGLPLAIELAAARIKLLPPQAILSRLEHALPLLAGGARDLPERQQTLRGAISWSYDLLDAPTQALMARFGVFRGGATFDIVELVCGSDDLGVDVLDGLSTLIEQSLMRQAETEGEPRFWMLETIREFAQEVAQARGEANAVRERHAATFVDLADRTAPLLNGPEEKRALDRFESENDNLRGALTWLLEQKDGARAARLVLACWRFWQMRGYIYEGRERADAVIAVLTSDDHLSRMYAFEAAGSLAYWAGDLDTTGAHYGRALESARVVGDRARLANALYNMSFIYSGRAATDLEARRSALELLEEALGIYEELQDLAGVAKSHWGLGELGHWSGEVDVAAQHFAQCEALFRSLNDRFGLAWTRHMQGLNLVERGDAAAARSAFADAITLFGETRDVSGVVLLLDDFARLEADAGDMPRALRLSAAAAGLERRSGVQLASWANQFLGLGRPSDLVDEAEWTEALAEGARMTFEEAVAYALGRAQR